MAHSLSQADVKRLLEDPSAEARTSTAEKVAADFGSGALSAEEREIAQDIFQIMVHDAEVRVREALSTNLKDCDFVSHEVALALANDVDAVSLPMLEFSSVLTDEDLIEVVRNHGPSKQKAVARRDTVSETVADALVDHGDEEVVATLVANDGAEISEPTLQKALDKHGEIKAVNESMTMRSKLPVAVAERLVAMVSETMKDHLLTHHDLPVEQVSDLVLQSRERATIGLLSTDSSTMDVNTLVEQLHSSGRLTPTIILRAVCLGDMRFFEASMAACTDIPLTNARKLIHDRSGLGLSAVLDKAGMPEALRPAFHAAIEVSHETEYDGGEHDQERFRRRMLERVLTLLEDADDRFGEENIEYLFTKLSQIDPDVMRMH